jgi:exodeoxyribonuclease (lambda-induced)
MQNGSDTEVEAREVYEFITGNEVCEVGVIYKNCGRLIGCSPDGLLTLLRKGLELKCPDEHTHVGYLVAEELPSVYIPQVQGSMFVTGYDEWDFMSYHQDFPPLIITVKRDEQYIAKLNKMTVDFVAEMVEKRKKLMKYKR